MTDAAATRRPGTRHRRALAVVVCRWTWLGLVPFFAFAVAFLIIPTFVPGRSAASRTSPANPTLQNYADLARPTIVSAFLTSIEISLVTAVIGGIFGFLLAYAVISRRPAGRPRAPALMTFSGVASNFAGVPLALAFTFTLGRLGFMTLFLQADRASTSTAAASRSTRSSASRSSISTSSSR